MPASPPVLSKQPQKDANVPLKNKDQILSSGKSNSWSQKFLQPTLTDDVVGSWRPVSRGEDLAQVFHFYLILI